MVEKRQKTKPWNGMPHSYRGNGEWGWSESTDWEEVALMWTGGTVKSKGKMRNKGVGMMIMRPDEMCLDEKGFARQGTEELFWWWSKFKRGGGGEPRRYSTKEHTGGMKEEGARESKDSWVDERGVYTTCYWLKAFGVNCIFPVIALWIAAVNENNTQFAKLERGKRWGNTRRKNGFEISVQVS